MVRTFGESEVVPGNLVFFRVEKEPSTLELLTEAGTPIAARVRTIGDDRVFAPLEPIAAGQRVRLRWSYRCTALEQVRAGEFSFETSAAVQPLAGQPELELVARGVRPWTAEFSRETDVSEGFADVRLAWSDDRSLASYAHLLDVRYEVDGKPVYGVNPVTVRTSCESAGNPIYDSCGSHHEFPAGAHTVRAIGHVIGTDISLDASLQVTISCGHDAGIADASIRGHDAAVRGVDGSVRDNERDVGPRGGNDVFEDDIEPEDDGCTLARGRYDAACLALGLALLLRRKRQ
ncbi:MAG TPA: hypothetical protein VFX59_16820 [Polyangiales bacterium]|nr:hypothetical protein [Polyangiales bacterium]